MRIGLVLPHFSQDCTWERLIGFSPTIERMGFDSVWARDHLAFEPGPWDPPGRRFLDPFVTLAAIAGRTSRLRLGTTVVVPLRHPLVTTQLFGSLAWVSQNRLELGLGVGGPVKQFEAVSIPYSDRTTLFKEIIEVVKLAMPETPFSYEGKLTSFSDVTIEPAPRPESLIWYGGASKIAIRRAHEYCDGIMPARIPFKRLDEALTVLWSKESKRGKRMLAGTVPFVSICRTHESAIKAIRDRVPELVKGLSRTHAVGLEELDDLQGSLIVGDSDECLAQLSKFAERGIDCVVLDFRLRMAEFEDMAHQLAEEVLPGASAL